MKFKITFVIYCLNIVIGYAQKFTYTQEQKIDYKKQFVHTVFDDKDGKIYSFLITDEKKKALDGIKTIVLNEELKKQTEKDMSLSSNFFNAENALKWFDENEPHALHFIYRSNIFKPLLDISTDSTITLIFTSISSNGLSCLKINKNSLNIVESNMKLPNFDPKEELLGALNEPNNKKIFTVNSATKHFNIYDVRDLKIISKAEINMSTTKKETFKSYFKGISILGQNNSIQQAASLNKMYLNGNTIYITHENIREQRPWLYQCVNIIKVDIEKKEFKEFTDFPAFRLNSTDDIIATIGNTFICENKLFKIYSDKKNKYSFTIKDLDSISNSSKEPIREYQISSDEDTIAFKNSPLYIKDKELWFDKKKYKSNAKFFFKSGLMDGQSDDYTIFVEKINNTYCVKIGSNIHAWYSNDGLTGSGMSMSYTEGGISRHEDYFVSYLDAKTLEHKRELLHKPNIIEIEGRLETTLLTNQFFINNKKYYEIIGVNKHYISVE